MAARYSPSARRRRLSMLLKQLREERGLKVNDVNSKLDWSAGKLSRMERNEWKLPSMRDMQDLARIYEVDQAMADALGSLARQARTRGWWVEYKDVLRGSLPDFESGASMIRTFEALLVPGLLQTPEYTAAVLRSGRVLSDEEIDLKVRFRAQRQAILDGEDAPRLWAVVDEAALRKPIGGRDVMREQVHHLVEMANRPHVDIHVVRDDAGAHAALNGPFVILDFPDPADLPIVYLETATEDLIVEQPQAIQRYVHLHGQACTSAESPEGSASYLQSLLDA